jgi:hypothetical protein
MRPPSTTPTTSALVALVAALPDEALRPLLLELLNGASASAGEPAPAGALAPEVRKRRRGWPKGKPRGRRPSTRAQDEGSTRAHQMKNGAAAPSNRRGKPGRRGPGRPRKEIDPGLDAKILAKRKREAQRQRDKRAAAKAKAADRGNAKPKKAGRGAADSKGPSPGLLARRKREAERLRAKRAAAEQAKAGNGSTEASGTKSPASATPTQAFWQHAEMLQPTAPYKAVANEFGLNPAQTKDCYRKAVLPPGLPGAAIERFLQVQAT